MLNRIKRASEYLRSSLKTRPEIGMITGTGLARLIETMDMDTRIPYGEIPNFPQSTAEGHKGMLVEGGLAGRSILAMQGRFHMYEGYTPWEVIFPVRVMVDLGVKYLLISSAAGGLNPQFKRGDLMLVTDHINLTGSNPLIGPNLEDFGPRFPDMSHAYSHDLMELARAKSRKGGLHLKEGVYVGITGPSMETPAETRFLRMAGADAVGMSTVFEAIAGVHCGLKVMAIVVITNVNIPESMEETSIEEVIKAADAAGPVLSRLWADIIRSLPRT
jgi:purine-nucleoside phosphorylase